MLLLLRHLCDHIGVHLYFGSHAAQPRRVRAFIDLAIDKLANSPAHVLSTKELTQAAGRWRTGLRS